MIDAWSVCVERRDGRLQPAISDGPPGLAVARRGDVTVLLSGELRDGGGADAAADAYLRWGDDCAEHLKGAFALVVLDERTQSVLAVRDRMGAHPLFHARRGDVLALSPMLDPLVAHGGATPDRFACATHLLGRAIRPDETFLAGIRRLPAGHRLVDRGGGTQVERYWAPPGPGTIELSFPEAAERFGGLVHSAAAGGDAVLLSGGMDSAAVAASLAPLVGGDAPLALSLSLSGSSADETATQRRVAAGLGLRQLLLDVRAAVAPRGLAAASLDLAGSSAAPPGLLMASYDALLRSGARRGVTVALNGEGGDEWLMPSPAFAVDRARRGDVRAVWLFWRAMSRYWPGHGRSSVARAIARGAVQDTVRRMSPARMRGRRRAGLEAGMPDWLLPEPADRAALAERLAGEREPELAVHPSVSILFEEAFATRARTGVAVAMPLLDADVVAFLAGLDPALLLRGGHAKALALDVIARRMPLARPWPRTVVGGDLWSAALEEGGEGALAPLRRARALVECGTVAPNATNLGQKSGQSLPKAAQSVQMFDLVAIASWLDARIVAA